MDTQKDDALKRAREHISNLEHAIQTLRELPAGLKDILRIHASDMNGEIFVTSAFDVETYKHNRRILYNDGWTVTKVFMVPDNGKRHTQLVKKDMTMSYIMTPHSVKSTCHKVKIGVETRDVFTVKCS